MFQKLAKLEVMFDELIKKINTGPKTCVSASKEAPTSVNPIKQIETVEELSALEEKLKNKNIFDEYVERMTFLCGNRGKGNGVDHAYMLMDNFFSRKFMTLCSWAGGARDKKEKIPFKYYKNVINLFFKLVYLADNDFTVQECEVFLKNVIRNSGRRYESANVRCSKSKKRPKNLSYKMKGIGNTQDEGTTKNTHDGGSKNDCGELELEGEDN